MDRPRRGGSRGPGGRSGRPPREDRPRGDRLHPAPYPERPRPSFADLFRTAKPIIGCVHLKPLPGSPGYDGHFLDLLDAALNDARALEEGGAAGLIVENFGDAPFYPDAVPPETIAVMTRLVTEIRKVVRIPVGVNVLRNDARAGVAVAAATGAGFVRVNVHTGVMVTDQGVLSGRAFESVRLRELLRSRTLLFADVRVKHAAPLAELEITDEAEDAVLRGHADALIITGAATGRKADMSLVAELKARLPNTAVLVGSGVTLESIEDVLSVADGCIVGTALKYDGRISAAVDGRRVRAMAEIAERISPRRSAVRSYEPPPESFAPPADEPVAPPAAEPAFVPDDRPARPRRPERSAERPTERTTESGGRPAPSSRVVSWKDVGTPVAGTEAPPPAPPASGAPTIPEGEDDTWAPAPWFDPEPMDAPIETPPAAPAKAPKAAPADPEPVVFGRAPIRRRRR